MSVYIDALCDHGWFLGPSSHMLADTDAELHEFAARLGMKREWFQPGSHPHYDLTAKRRARAVVLGAIELERRAFAEKMSVLRAARSSLAGIAATKDAAVEEATRQALAGEFVMLLAEQPTALRRHGKSAIERITGPRPTGHWGLVVRQDGAALEVLLKRDAQSGQLEVLDAMLHLRVLGARGLTDAQRDALDGVVVGSCDLTGGRCLSEGVVTYLQPKLALAMVTDGDGYEQPEAFWQVLEDELERAVLSALDRLGAGAGAGAGAEPSA